MKKLLFIDSCIRGEQSRTKIIADAFFNVLRKSGHFAIETVAIDELTIVPLGKRELELREQLLADNRRDDSSFDLVKQFAQADLIAVAAPFWDMGIPAKLKTYFENVSVSGFTFSYDGVKFEGLCKAELMVYITTRGMDIEDGDVMEQASPYLLALTKFFGIGGFKTVSACSLDTRPNEADERIAKAVAEAVDLAKTISKM